MTNPKTKTADNTEKDPADWVSGDEPMTGAQHRISRRYQSKHTNPTRITTA